MNGNTHRAYLATHLENPETLADVEKRISSGRRLLTQIVGRCSDQLSDTILASLDDWVRNQVNVLTVEPYLNDQDIRPSVRPTSRCFESARRILHDEHLKRFNQ
ncbi:MAG: hypothetical protein F4X44_03610 [Gammaproteobacteria bacterium]|nr:hypothetical protein [Gammaproteobacteria bacterium]MYD79681.1 hypothetical protein [Gammaproteobacteria bacterium]